MQGRFEISVDRRLGLVRLWIGGLFTLEDLHDFAVAQREAYSRLGAARGSHRTLCDVSDCKIQLQQVVEGFRSLLIDPSLMSARMAFVTGNSPAKMQIRRLISRDSCQFFDNAAEAERWLLHGEALSAPARGVAAA